MQNKEFWRPTKFIYRKNKLIASRDSRNVGIASRLMADIVASHYDMHLKNHASGRLIDLGCGKVPLYSSYKDLVSESICVDWNSNQKDSHLDFICDLNQPLPFNDGEFDTVILSDVLEHIANPESLWKEMSRIIRPGGKIILNVPFFYKLHEMPYDFFRYTEFALANFANANDFQIILLKPLGGVPEILTDIISKNMLYIPFLGKYISIFLQGLCKVFLRLPVGRKISIKTSKTFPLGYFLIAQKNPLPNG